MRTLKDIIEYKKDEVHREKKLYSKSQLHELISTIDDPRKFSKNLSSNNQNIGLIAEIKKASPSKGVIRTKHKTSLALSEVQKYLPRCFDPKSLYNLENMENAILQNKNTTELKVIAAKDKFVTMQEMGRSYLVEGVISFEEFERVLSV